MDDLLRNLPSDWLSRLGKVWHTPWFSGLYHFLKQEWAGSFPIYPPKEQIFNALSHVPFDKVKVVIMGQDPYHGAGQAHGLSFSVLPGITTPPSLKNIYKEMEQDLGISPSSHGCLTPWAEQGVLVLNATLTVRASQPKSHFGQGWERLTDEIVRLLSEREDPLVFFLWGKSAEEKCAHLLGAKTQHLILVAPHPSPYSASSGFFGCRHFSKANEFLQSIGKEPVDWRIEK